MCAVFAACAKRIVVKDVGVVYGVVFGIIGRNGNKAVVLNKMFQICVVKKEGGPQNTKRQPGRVQPPFGSDAQAPR